MVYSIDADHDVPPVPGRVGGASQAHRVIQRFIVEKLPHYASKRNDIVSEATSGLSPYLHFGQISSLRVALEVGAADVPNDCVDAFLEQVIVRRELAINFCLYNPNYSTLAAAPQWALDTLNKHRGDPRPEIYTRDELEGASTHDELLNAAQSELIRYGTIHPYMRMVWAKKLLEWCASPEDALSTAIYLNDKYALDGRDPNGYANIAWCIYGKYDRPFRERPIFGKVRYMSTESTKRKMYWEQYVQHVSRWSP